MAYAPGRGDVVWIDFQPQAGHEQAERRPGLVVSPESYKSRVSLALLAPITNRAKGYPFEVPIPLGADVTGVVLADQVKSLDWRARRAEHLCSLEDRVARAVIQRIQRLLE